jgi:hypothetical protein
MPPTVPGHRPASDLGVKRQKAVDGLVEEETPQKLMIR